MLMVLITLFVLFVATWLARILANRISTPITAILEAAGEVRRGNLQHRVTVRAEDELALLVTRLQPDDRGAGIERHRAGPAAALHRSHPGEHSDGRDLDRLRRLASNT